MTTPDEDLVRSMYTGFSSLASGGDVDEYVRAHDHQDIEYRAVEEIEPVRGHQALIDWTVRWFEAWEGRILRMSDHLERDDAVAAARSA